jgi:hypothetical protein
MKTEDGRFLVGEPMNKEQAMANRRNNPSDESEYKIGGIIWWRNSHGQSFAARIVRIWEGKLIIAYEQPPGPHIHEQVWDRNKMMVIRSRYFPPSDPITLLSTKKAH